MKKPLAPPRPLRMLPVRCDVQIFGARLHPSPPMRREVSALLLVALGRDQPRRGRGRAEVGARSWAGQEGMPRELL